MSDLDDFFESVKLAYSRQGGSNWPASGKKITNSYIKLAALNQLRQLKEIMKRKSDLEVARLFWSTTQIRYLLTGEFIVGLKICERDEKAPSLNQITECVQYLLGLLKLKAVEDPFCLNNGNKILTERQAAELANSIHWNSTNKALMKKAIVSATSLAWAFGYDTHFSNFMEIHGPYIVGENKQMLVREFKLDSVREVWPDAPKFSERIKLYAIYENKSISLDWELHHKETTELKLEKYFAVLIANGKERIISGNELEKFVEKNNDAAIKQVEYVNSLPLLDKVRKGALLSFLQTKCLADELGEDWKPSLEVERSIQEKGEAEWNAPSKKPKNPDVIKSDWIKIFDPRIPMD